MGMMIIDVHGELEGDYDIVMKLPTAEVIPKADYETRLKADLKAILVELQLEIEETDSGCGWDGYIKKGVINDYFQQKINSLKENT